jgi:hypothetical protein
MNELTKIQKEAAAARAEMLKGYKENGAVNFYNRAVKKHYERNLLFDKVILTLLGEEVKE